MVRDCGAWVNLVAHTLKKRLNAKLADLGITGVQSHVMHYILAHCADGPVYQRDVEEVFCIRRSTASRFLQNLERDGMLVRRSVPRDARLKKLIPTEKALAVHACIAEKFQIAEKLMTAGLTEGEVEQFIATARKIQHNLLE